MKKGVQMSMEFLITLIIILVVIVILVLAVKEKLGAIFG
jgi:uncharacterized protein (UPF0333 family)